MAVGTGVALFDQKIYTAKKNDHSNLTYMRFHVQEMSFKSMRSTLNAAHKDTCILRYCLHGKHVYGIQFSFRKWCDMGLH